MRISDWSSDVCSSDLSLFRALMAFALAVVIAVPVGFWLGLNREAYEWVSPVLSVLLPLPAVAWTPIFLDALGLGYKKSLDEEIAEMQDADKVADELAADRKTAV